MSFHGRVELAAVCAGWQIQPSIQGENLEEVAMRPGGWTRPAVARFSEIIFTLQGACWRAAIGDLASFGIDIPDDPVRKQSTRRVRIIDDQRQALGCRRNFLNLQRRARIRTIAGKLGGNICTLLKSGTRDLHLLASNGG